jgi:hypothetical protein
MTTPSGTRYNRFPAEAERLGICQRSLATWCAQKTIPYFKCGKIVLFNPQAVDAALARFRVGPASGPKRRAGRITE